MKRLFFLLAVSALALTSCEREEDPSNTFTGHNLEIRVVLQNGGENLDVGEPFAFEAGRDMQVEMLRFYISRLELVQSSGSTEVQDLALMDLADPDKSILKLDVPAGTYEGIRFGVGPDSVQNATDPTTVAPEHPLSAAQDMFWTWASQYRFIRFEGRTNTTGNLGSSNDVLLSYHPGTNPLRRTVNLDEALTVSDNARTTVTLYIEVQGLFNGPGGVIDPVTENQSHTTPSDYAIADKLITNFAAAVHR